VPQAKQSPSFLEALAAEVAKTNGGKICAVAVVLQDETIPADVRQQLTEALAQPGHKIPTSALARACKAIGLDGLNEGRVGHHRRGQCACPRT
jgi:hypothetical protein